MSRLLVCALALASALGGACGGAKDKVVKTVKKEKEPDAKSLLADAREAANAGNLLDADKYYGRSFAISNEFDTLEEHVDFLRGSVEEFEASHPKVVQLVNHLANTLAGLGI
jgi:hypothetical protein